ncbi:NADPH-dependent FMN reductase [Sphingobacterium suaedae]|uniref:NADPH-dependent FMN reductase n=1 Tax=Sphingobacterium suaedae TaxID=1686402 RepID=A0ABW5KH86_9SPHI
MNVLVFNGALDRRPASTAERISNYLKELLNAQDVHVDIFNIAESGIPLFDMQLTKIPNAVELMNLRFAHADAHIWLTPLYHGSMTGVMKNCLDWLECSSKAPKPYLAGKRVGLICWADGVQAMQGINGMDVVAKSLRAWTLPYSVPIQKKDLFESDGYVTAPYAERFNLLVRILLEGPDGATK